MSEIGPQLLEQMYETTATIRRFEQRAIEQYRLGQIRGYLHPYLGQEGIAVGSIAAIEPDDYIVSTHRGHGHAIAKGHDPRLMMAELFGKETGYCHGRGGSMHVASRAIRNLGANGVVAGGLGIATGSALAIKQRAGSEVVVAFCSDGASANGMWHESMNLAAIWDLPVIFVLENNQYAVSTPIRDSARVEHLSTRAAGYGMPGVTVDGNDAAIVYGAMQEPLRRARAGEGPSLLECMTFRHGGHHVNDPGLYLPAEQLAHWKARDPLVLLRERLTRAGVGEAEIAAIDERVEQLLEEAVEFATASDNPSIDEFRAEIAAGELAFVS
ncbi:MAG TPA: thiamine pyrophosphate-dependent dehydrogenase E1 component subunit alpha [Candidatus Limnocylindrales bacterium]|jgi:pyruvate dehydrogenase E1 component alpha subunit